eukprot:gene7051-7633_t
MKNKLVWFLDIVLNDSVPDVNLHGKVIEDSGAILDYLEKHTPPEFYLSSLPICNRYSSLLKELRDYSLK